MLWHISLVSPLLVVSFEVEIHRKVSDLGSPSFLGSSLPCWLDHSTSNRSTVPLVCDQEGEVVSRES